jgi:hypothetical protein
MELLYALMAILIILVSLVAPPYLAARKGYSWYLWTIACGILGLIVLAFLPYANRPSDGPDVNQYRRQLGNTIGGVLSVLGFLVIGFLVMAVLAPWGSGRWG